MFNLVKDSNQCIETGWNIKHKSLDFIPVNSPIERMKTHRYFKLVDGKILKGIEVNRLPARTRK